MRGGQFQSEEISRAMDEDKLTTLLHDLLTTEPPADGIVDESPEGVNRLRELLSCGGRFNVPVLDLVAVLPDPDLRDIQGLHIASYYARNGFDRWYWGLLENFFNTGKGSLLALEDYTQYIGKCQYFMKDPESSPVPGPRKTPLTERMTFSPKQKVHKVDVEDRFAEYAKPVLAQVDGPARMAWICFGPRGRRSKNSLRWGGSLFAVMSSSNPSDLQSPALSEAVDYVYSVVNASFYRTIVDRAQQAEAAHRLALTYFAFGHDLKNRLARIDKYSVLALKEKLEQQAPALVPDIDQCHELLQVLTGMCGVFGAVAKTKGRLPFAWTPSAKARPKQLAQALVEAVQSFVHLEDSVEPAKQRMLLRRVSTSGALKKIERPRVFGATALPPFEMENTEPSLCFLSGLAELCRNAARYVLNTPRLKRPHVDFSIEVSDDMVATVKLYNPVVGEDATHSHSIKLLAELFTTFGNVEGKVVTIVPATMKEDYAHGFDGYRYAESCFVYAPNNLRFEEDIE